MADIQTSTGDPFVRLRSVPIQPRFRDVLAMLGAALQVFENHEFGGLVSYDALLLTEDAEEKLWRLNDTNSEQSDSCSISYAQACVAGAIALLKDAKDRRYENSEDLSLKDSASRLHRKNSLLNLIQLLALACKELEALGICSNPVPAQ